MKRLLPALLMMLVLAACGDDAPEEDEKVNEGPLICDSCKARAADIGTHICGVTIWCANCQQDSGDGHRCGSMVKTTFCVTCKRDTADNHECHRTIICQNCLALRPDDLKEHAPNHVCGKTRYCPSCHRDVGPGHSCSDKSFFCVSCHVERLEKDHRCRQSSYCSECRTEASSDATEHVHHVTRFCGKCAREAALPHGH